MSTGSAIAVSGERVHADLRDRVPRTPRPMDGLTRIVVFLLSMFVVVLPTDLRILDGKSLAMRLGYACLMVGIVAVIKRRTAVLPSSGFWCLLGFVLWSSCTLVWAQFPEAAHHKALEYWLLFAVVAIIPQFAWAPRIRGILMDAYIAGCWLGVIGLVVNYSAAIQYSAEGAADMEGRYSFGTDPNYLALALVIGLPLAFYRFSSVHAAWQKAFTLLYAPAALAGVVLTGSRGATIALLATVLALGLFTSWRTRLLLAGGAALCMAVVTFLPSQVSERLSTIPDELRYGTLSDRRELWDRGTVVAEQHPIEGVGAGATAGMFDIAAHNTPLELTMEGGAVSLALFFGAGLLGIRRTWRNNPQEGRAAVAVCAAWLVGSLSLSWEVNTVTWFILAMLFSAGSQRIQFPKPMSARQAFARPA